MADALPLSIVRHVYKNSLLNSEIVRQASGETTDPANSAWLNARADQIAQFAEQLNQEIRDREASGE